MNRTSLALVVLASILAVAVPRWLVRSAAPYNWDAASFTLAVDAIDLPQHRPHPPAAIGFVLTARALRPLVGGDNHAALVLENAIFAVVSSVLVFLLALGHGTSRSTTRAWLAWLVLATSVQHAFNASVAEVYMSELALTLLVAALGWQAVRGSARSLTGMAVALAVTGAFRLTGMVFMTPLAAWVCWQAPVSLRAKRTAVLAGIACLGLWLVPFIALAGFDDVVGRTWTQFTAVSGDTSVAGGNALRQLNRNIRDVSYSIATGVGVFNVLALPLVWVTCRPGRLERRPRVFGLLWIVPALSFFTLVHMGKMGYTLLLLPGMALLTARTYAAAGPTVRLVLIVGQVALGAAHFFLAAPPTGAAIGAGLAYRDKTLGQQLLTESRTLLATTAPVLRQAEAELRLARTRVAEACPDDRKAVLVAGDGEGLSWRRAMVAWPDHVVVRLPAGGRDELFVARGGRFSTEAAAEFSVPDACAIVWLAPVDELPLGVFSDQAGDLAWPVILPAPVRLELRPGSPVLVVRRPGLPPPG